jgi:DNA-binding IclR family transcriptional regulator
VSETRPDWTFLTNHAHVLLCIAGDSEIRLRDIAERVGITERAATRIVADLVEGGYVSRTRVGRRNEYTIDPRLPLRHPLESHQAVGALLEVLQARGRTKRS